MPYRLQHLCQHWLTSAQLAWNDVARTIADRRLNRLYGDLPRQTLAPPRSVEAQAERLASIVKRHCGQGSSIVATHGSAAIKLDAAEYAFSAMLEELRGTIKTLPSTWTPDRMVPAMNVDAAVEDRKARSAA